MDYSGLSLSLITVDTFAPVDLDGDEDDGDDADADDGDGDSDDDAVVDVGMIGTAPVFRLIRPCDVEGPEFDGSICWAVVLELFWFVLFELLPCWVSVVGWVDGVVSALLDGTGVCWSSSLFGGGGWFW